MKKIISYLITVMMVFTMVPYTAFATGESAHNAGRINLYIEQFNPLYSDEERTVTVIDNEPLAAFDEEIVPNGSGYTEPISTKEEAVSILRNGMVQRQQEITVRVKAEELSQEVITKLADDIFYATGDHTGVPVEGDSLKFVWASRGIAVAAYEENGEIIVELTYYVDYFTTHEQEKELNEAVDVLLDDIIDADMSDYEKIEAIYDYMTGNIVYDYENLNDVYYTLKATAYAALVNKTAVCQGYAVLFYRLALECGVDARVISGDAGGPHAWNIVELEGKYYLVDATWDATYAQNGLQYAYFLLPAFSDHTADDEYTDAAFTSKYPMADTAYALCTEHVPEVIPEKAATCTTAGMSYGSKCASCGKILVAQTESTPALGHEEIAHSGKPATCTESGWKDYVTCSRCDYTTYQVEPALKHDITSYDGKDKTCTEAGWEPYEACSRCDYTTYREIPTTGHDFVWVVDQEATEDQFGIKHEQCSVCNEKRNESTMIPKLDHVHAMDKIFAKEMTCGSDGNKEYFKCTKCGKFYADEAGQLQVTEEEMVIPAKGHEFGPWNVRDEATCTVEGLKYRSCYDCMSTEIENIPEMGHNVVSHNAKDPTCTDIGWDAYEKCTRCDYTTYKELPAKGHNFVWSVDTPATDMAAGVKHEECTGCSEKRNENTTIPKLDCVHKMEKTTGVEATCTTAGVVEHYTCTKCEKVFADENGQLQLSAEAIVIAPLDHYYIKTGAKNPTCTEVGWDAYKTCSRCGHTTYKELPATGHKETVDPGVEPSCTGSGSTDGLHCSTCGMILVMPEIIDPTGHNVVKIPAVEPTCDEYGYTEGYKCATCGEYMEQPQPVKPIGHDYTEWTVKTPATCNTQGYNERSCHCGAYEVSLVDSLGHTWETVFTVDTAATTGRPGSKAIHCATCDAEKEGSAVKIARIKKTTASTLVYNGSKRTNNVTVVDYNGKKLEKGKDFTVTYKNAAGTKVVTPKNVGKYKAIVKFQGDYSGTVTKTFIINPKVPANVKVTKPAKKQIKVTWKKYTAQVTGYEIRYSTKQSMPETYDKSGKVKVNGKYTKHIIVKNNFTTKKIIKNLKSKKKYWVQVRTYKTVNGVKYYSAWSKVKKVKTK